MCRDGRYSKFHPRYLPWKSTVDWLYPDTCFVIVVTKLKQVQQSNWSTITITIVTWCMLIKKIKGGNLLNLSMILHRYIKWIKSLIFVNFELITFICCKLCKCAFEVFCVLCVLCRHLWSFRCVSDGASKGVLNVLKSVYLSLRKIKVQKVTVVECTILLLLLLEGRQASDKNL